MEMYKVNLNSIEDSFPNNVMKEFEYSKKATEAIAIISKELTELYNFIEPGLFDNKIIVFKNLNDNIAFPTEQSVSLKMNKANLYGFRNDIVIQLFSDRNILMWEKYDITSLFSCEQNLIYVYDTNTEKIFAKRKEIDISTGSFGSRFSNEFNDLEQQLNNYYIHKVKHSSCPLFAQAWNSEKRIFFKGGGKDIPEKYMQESLHNFIKDLSIFKGEVGQFDPTREHNLNASKPVDIIVRWEKSNRIALIEIKWLGKSINNERVTSEHSNSRANQGFEQLKGYFDLAKQDNPNKIIKCYLIVIDGRRKNTTIQSKSISFENGMHYEFKEIELSDDKKYHQTYKNIHKPIRMFAEPICN